MPHRPVAAIMVHVDNVERGLAWYQRAFPSAVRTIAPDSNLVFLQIGNVQLDVVPCDEKVASGAAGSVVDWKVPGLEDALHHFGSLGAAPYRGPLRIEAGQAMCQVKDP
jgi:hypothetical protein